MSGAANRAEALLDIGRPAEAADLLREALAGEPEDPDLHCRLALALTLAERPKESLAAAERAAALAPDHEWPHRLRSVALRAMGKARLSVEAAEEAVRLAPQEAMTHEVLADARLAAKDRRGAREAAERARELDPASAGVRRTLGDIALAEDRLAWAEDHYREALELDPTDPAALNNLAIALQRQGRDDAALELFERAARADPGDRTARVNLARTSRSKVNGVAAVILCAFVARLFTKAIESGDAVAAVVLGAALAGAVAFFVVRSRRRARELSPATQMVLADQRWWEKIELTSWRPLFWFIPSPVWLAVALVAFTGGMLDAFRSGWDATAIAVQLGLLVLIAVFAHYSRLWLRRRGWISF